jgi:hypothetical protein
MKNFDTDQRLQSMPELANFYQGLAAFSTAAEELQKNPAFAYQYYTNPQFAANSAQFMMMMTQASQTAKTLPELTTSKGSFSLTSQSSSHSHFSHNYNNHNHNHSSTPNLP